MRDTSQVCRLIFLAFFVTRSVCLYSSPFWGVCLILQDAQGEGHVYKPSMALPFDPLEQANRSSTGGMLTATESAYASPLKSTPFLPILQKIDAQIQRSKGALKLADGCDDHERLSENIIKLRDEYVTVVYSMQDAIKSRRVAARE